MIIVVFADIVIKLLVAQGFISQLPFSLHER
jgi:hypothetical protein